MVTLSDLQMHLVKFGIDVYPPIEIPNERTRLNLFFEKATGEWPQLYRELHASDQRFEIAGSFGGNRSAPFPTFVLTPRGPVFVFPLRLPPPVNDTEIREDSVGDTFARVRGALLGSIPGHKCLRVGLVRELTFGSGSIPLYKAATSSEEFSGARIVGGESLAHYRDDQYNVRIKLVTVEVAKSTRLPVGYSVTEPAGYGLQVSLDVNNAEIRPLEDADIQGIIDRATRLWPEDLLNYLKKRLE